MTIIAVNRLDKITEGNVQTPRFARLIEDIVTEVNELPDDIATNTAAIATLTTITDAYTTTNVTTDRILDADSTTTAELADVVGTIIADLQAKGIL